MNFVQFTRIVLACLMVTAVAVELARAQVPTAFTYQGELDHAGALANGPYDFEFVLFDADSDGMTIAGPLRVEDATVREGIFSVVIDFGVNVFGLTEESWLEIRVRVGASAGGFTILEPRQRVTAAPYALFADRVRSRENVVVVATRGGDFATIQAALDSIVDADFGNRYVVQVAPGFYNEKVTMKPFVSLRGAGKELTYILSTGSDDPTVATVTGLDVATLSHLTLGSTGNTDYTVGIFANGSDAHIEHVRVSVAGATIAGYGILHQGGSMSLNQVSIDVNGPTAIGVYHQLTGGGISIRNSDVRAAGGDNAWGLRHVQTNGGGFVVEDSEIEAVGVNAYGIASAQAYELRIADSQVRAVSGATPGSGTSYAVTTDTLGFVTITRSTLEAYNGGNNRALSLRGNPGFADSENRILDSVMTVADGQTAYGILLFEAPNTQIVGTTIELRNGMDNRAVQIQDGSAAIRNTSITTHGGSNFDYGLLVVSGSGSMTVSVDHVTIEADDTTIFQGGSGTPTTLVGASRLDGDAIVVNSGSVTCAGVYDELRSFFANTCP